MRMFIIDVCALKESKCKGRKKIDKSMRKSSFKARNNSPPVAQL